MRPRRPRRDALRRKQEALKLMASLPLPAVAKALGVDLRTVQRYKREAAAYLAMRGIAF
jgi:hypothetical protein